MKPNRIRKFYRTEKERNDKIKKNMRYFVPIKNAIGKEVGALLHKGVKFCILDIKDKTIHVAAWACCGTPEHMLDVILDQDTKKTIENKILYNTPINKVIWEV